jgi:hypothetical protein
MASTAAASGGNRATDCSNNAASSLCRVCRGIPWSDVLLRNDAHVLWHSLPSLRTSALRGLDRSGKGCRLCALFYNGLIRSTGDHPDMPEHVPTAGDPIRETTPICEDCQKRTVGAGLILVGSLEVG